LASLEQLTGRGQGCPTPRSCERPRVTFKLPDGDFLLRASRTCNPITEPAFRMPVRSNGATQSAERRQNPVACGLYQISAMLLDHLHRNFIVAIQQSAKSPIFYLYNIPMRRDMDRSGFHMTSKSSSPGRLLMATGVDHDD
jgi:hypothetical protein